MKINIKEYYVSWLFTVEIPLCRNFNQPDETVFGNQQNFSFQCVSKQAINIISGYIYAELTIHIVD